MYEIMSEDDKIKSSIKCPACGVLLQWNKIHTVFCKACNYRKGQFDMLHFINANIAVGNETSALDDELLSLCKIDAILTVATDFTGRIDTSIPHIKVGLSDSINNKKETFYDAVHSLKCLIDKHQRTLVHCMGGSRRSVAVAAFLLSSGKEEQYWNIVKTFQNTRPAVNPDNGIHDFLTSRIWSD